MIIVRKARMLTNYMITVILTTLTMPIVLANHVKCPFCITY